METVYRAVDVAEYLLRRHDGPMSAFKLQKIVYYAQAWSLALRDVQLFEEPIEAWVNGPVVREVYDRHRGRYTVATVGGEPERIDDYDAPFLNDVLAAYDQFEPHELVSMTHADRPWIEARAGKPLRQAGTDRISLDTMRDYYRALHADPTAVSIDY